MTKMFAYLPQEVEWMKDLMIDQFGLSEEAWTTTWEACADDSRRRYSVAEAKIVEAQEELKHLAWYRFERRKQLKEGIEAQKRWRIRMMRREYVAILLFAPHVATPPPDEIMDLSTYGKDII